VVGGLLATEDEVVTTGEAALAPLGVEQDRVVRLPATGARERRDPHRVGLETRGQPVSQWCAEVVERIHDGHAVDPLA
jgi:hypothetical protein